MAQLNNFNAREVSPESQFSPVPNGEYPVIITESEWKDTRAGNGRYIQMVLEIVDGPYKGRKIWDRLNLENPNATAVEIAKRALSQICHALDELDASDTATLHNKPLIAKIVCKQSPCYDDSNDVKEYKPFGSGTSAASEAPATAAHPEAPAAQLQTNEQEATSNKPAWA